MKTLILVMLLASFSLSAGTRKDIGIVDTRSGHKLYVMVSESHGVKRVMLYNVDKYRIRKVMTGMDLFKLKLYRDLLNKAIEDLEK